MGRPVLATGCVDDFGHQVSADVLHIIEFNARHPMKRAAGDVEQRPDLIPSAQLREGVGDDGGLIEAGPRPGSGLRAVPQIMFVRIAKRGKRIQWSVMRDALREVIGIK
jgi:hypothetical protein